MNLENILQVKEVTEVYIRYDSIHMEAQNREISGHEKQSSGYLGLGKGTHRWTFFWGRQKFSKIDHGDGFTYLDYTKKNKPTLKSEHTSELCT